MIWLLGVIGGSALLLLGIGMVWIGGLRRVSEEQRAEAAKQKRELEELLAMPGWKHVEQWATSNAEDRSNLVLHSPAEKPLEQEFTKGEISGLKMFVRVPKLLIAQNEAILAAYAKERGLNDVRDDAEEDLDD